MTWIHAKSCTQECSGSTSAPCVLLSGAWVGQCVRMSQYQVMTMVFSQEASKQYEVAARRGDDGGAAAASIASRLRVVQHFDRALQLAASNADASLDLCQNLLTEVRSLEHRPELLA